MSPDRESVLDWGIHEEVGAIVFGVRWADPRVPRSLMLQIDVEGSEQRRDAWGMWVALDGREFYGGVRAFREAPNGRIVVSLDPVLSGGVEEVLVALPALAPAKRDLLRRMLMTYATDPNREARLTDEG